MEKNILFVEDGSLTKESIEKLKKLGFEVFQYKQNFNVPEMKIVNVSDKTESVAFDEYKVLQTFKKLFDECTINTYREDNLLYDPTCRTTTTSIRFTGTLDDFTTAFLKIYKGA